MPTKPSREQILRKERRMVRVPVDVGLVARYLLRPKDNLRLELAEELPKDSVFVCAYYSAESMSVMFVFAHELFDMVDIGINLPIRQTVIKEVAISEPETEY